MRSIGISRLRYVCVNDRRAAAKQTKTALILLVPSEICTLEVARKVIERCSTGGITPVKIIDCRNAKLMQPCVHRIVFQNARRRIHHSLQSRLIARLVLRRAASQISGLRIPGDRSLFVSGGIGRASPVFLRDFLLIRREIRVVELIVRQVARLFADGHTNVPQVAAARDIDLGPLGDLRLDLRFQRIMTGAHLNEIAECGDRDILAHALPLAEKRVADVVAVIVSDRILAIFDCRLEELVCGLIAESVPLRNLIHHQVRHDGMPHRLRALQAAEHILNAVKVMICSADRIPLHVAGILTPDRDRVIAYLLIKFRTLPAARDQLRREVEIVCQLLFEQHMELLPHLGAHIVIPTRGKFDEPYNVRLVLRLQVCIVTRIKTHDTVRHIVIDRRIRHVLQHQPIQLKRELMAVAPANSGAIARIAAATAALKTVRACLRHKCQRIFHAPPLDEIRADRKRVGLLARAGEIEVRVRLRLQTGEIGNALLHRPGLDDRVSLHVHDPELRAVHHIRATGPHGCPIVIADLIDEDRRFLGAAARRRINSIRCLSGRRQAHRVGIDPPRRFRRQREGRSRRRADHA